uniref:Uncharacterized protein n=2 Tax=Rhodosorus marinus TaxID=101924 RepID=A0A7S3E7G3_9RHOD|mmetsp:Transcript_11531/g.47991  ORF Transcript_11531/g.47991 Transcript_11531/m.47991 type:complete len:216 (+) Transcript_11531:723-1370(+)
MTTSETYVDLGRVIAELRKRGDEGPLYVGTYTGTKKPIRNVSDTFFISEDEYKFGRFPGHHDDKGYAISWSLMKSMADCLPEDPSCAYRGFASCRVPRACAFRPIRFPDVTLGGIVMGATAGTGGQLNLDCGENDQNCKDIEFNYRMHTMVNLDNFVHSLNKAELCGRANPNRELLPLVVRVKSARTMRRLHVLVTALEEKDTDLIEHVCGLGDF